jgi:Na+:H+ antiporter, NhaA family
VRRSRLLSPLVEFLRTEAAGGVALLVAAVAALVWANSPWASSYGRLWEHRLALGTGPLGRSEDLRHWVNDGLMALFFFVVGLEIKRELVRGELRNRRAAALPVVAAVGGMAGAALVYLAVAGSSAPRGWAVPMATDIALVLGVLALAGRHAPPGLKLFLLALAIADDLATIVVVAVAYSAGLHPSWIGGALLSLVVVVMLNRVEASHPVAFVVPAVAVWWCTLHSGVPATVCGIVLAALVPVGPVRERPVLERLETRLHPLSSFVVVPVFALANLGVDISRASLAHTFDNAVGWGVFAARVGGKPVGVVAATAAAVALGVAPMPRGMGRRHLMVVGVLTGLGFTVPLVVADLAFTTADRIAVSTLALLVGSCVAGLLGSVLLVRLRSTAVRTMAMVDDLMDRSRLEAAVPAIAFVRAAPECEGADVVVVDIARHLADVAAVRAAAPAARIVGFGPHVDEAAASQALTAGADEVLARSRFFHDPAAALET